MPTGRPVDYLRYNYPQLKKGVKLSPHKDALRAYICAENGLVRWCYSAENETLEYNPNVGMPLFPTHEIEFDTDLKYLHLWAGATDVVAHVYYFRSA